MHGGDIYRNEVEVDFSVNLNPLGIHENILNAMKKSLSFAANYPDITSYSLKKSLAEKLNIDMSKLLCGNGASELILALTRFINPKSALLVAPGFSGYIRALEAIDCKISYFYLDEIKAFIPDKSLLNMISEEKPDILFFSNPSNPSGVLMDFDFIKTLCAICKRAGTKIIIDECFIDLSFNGKKNSSLKLIDEYDNLFILNAFTKSYALAGIRLGYVICHKKEIADKLSKEIAEWNVSVVAQAAGVAAIKEDKYIEDSRNLIESEREYLIKELETLGFKTYPSKANFILFLCDEKKLKEKLLERKILIRDCSDYEGLEKGFFRIAVKKREENEVLIKALCEICK